MWEYIILRKIYFKTLSGLELELVYTLKHEGFISQKKKSAYLLSITVAVNIYKHEHLKS